MNLLMRGKLINKLSTIVNYDHLMYHFKGKNVREKSFDDLIIAEIIAEIMAEKSRKNQNEFKSDLTDVRNNSNE